MLINAIDSVRNIEFPEIGDETGALTVMEVGAQVQMEIRRVFVVIAAPGTVRGRHAHRRCAQIYVCLHGACRVRVSDGEQEHSFVLNTPRAGLLVPPSIWSEQTYVEPDTVLMVLCDRPYEADDYIRDYDAFLAHRAGAVRA